MQRLLRDLALILTLAGIWALSGYTIGVALETAGVAYPFLKIVLASLNVIIGMVLFKGIIREPTAERLFFEGPNREDEGELRIGCLWLLPLSLFLWGLYMWGIAALLRFIFPR